ncbi:hypothetical protein CBR_g38401 [Chara braunii]|uniref:Uncharacterized protein n=1 Tax=Chara braunii TaxID=69332 RepID=A0A388JNK7_CHABU|nr:hypothetical protein CBR_g38401 [Chara braunii]|eukprot:GBG59374.1 hypothetical protein CBR_g38401 [Chara braunii]
MGAGILDGAMELCKAKLRERLNDTGMALGTYAQPYHDEFRLIGTAYGMLPAKLIMAMHFLCACNNPDRKHFKAYYAVSFWVSFFAAAGGGSLANMLMQEQPAVFVDDAVLPIFAICWFLVNYAPKEIGAVMFDFFPIRLICRIASSINRARSICDKADLAVEKLGPGMFVGPVLVGSIAGLGGKLLFDFASRLFVSKKVAGPVSRELVYPSWATWSACACSFTYLLTTYWMPMLPKDVSCTLVVTILVCQVLASELSGGPADLSAPIVSCFHKISGIPAPEVCAVPSKPVKEVKKAAGNREGEEEDAAGVTEAPKKRKKKEQKKEA